MPYKDAKNNPGLDLLPIRKNHHPTPRLVSFIEGRYALVGQGGWQAHKQRLEHCLRQEHKAD